MRKRSRPNGVLGVDRAAQRPLCDFDGLRVESLERFISFSRYSTKVFAMRDLAISVVIPYHNEGELLRRALDSLENQEFSGAAEVIVVDDCSDIPPPIPAEFRWELKAIRTESTQYAGGARQIGVDAARGKYVCFLDADDEFEPWRLQSHVDLLDKHPDVVMVGGATTIIQPDQTRLLYYPKSFHYASADNAGDFILAHAAFPQDICMNYCFHTGAFTTPKSVLVQAGGFDVDLRWGEEWELQVRIAQQGPVAYVPQPVNLYIKRSDSITSTESPRKHESGARMRERWLRSYKTLSFSQQKKLAVDIAERYLWAAQTWHSCEGRAGRAWMCAWKSVLAHPSMWGAKWVVKYALLTLISPLTAVLSNKKRRETKDE